MRRARPGPRKRLREMTTWCCCIEKEVKSQPRPVRRPPMVAGSRGLNLPTKEVAKGARSCEEAKPRAGTIGKRAGSAFGKREERSRDRTWKEAR